MREAGPGAYEDNPASLAVSRKLGYRDDGIERHVVRGRPAVLRRLRLDRATWQAQQAQQAQPPADIDGLDGCLPSFGLTG